MERHNIIDNRECQRSNDRAKRNIMRKQNDEDKSEQHQNKGKRVDNQHDPRKRCYTLTALESVIKWERMTEQTSKARNIRKAKRIGHDQKTEKRGERTLQKVAKERERRRLDAVSTKHIGRARVSAAMCTNIVMMKYLGKNDGKIDTAEQIRHDDTNHHSKEKRHGSKFKAEHTNDSLLKTFMIKISHKISVLPHGGKLNFWN